MKNEILEQMLFCLDLVYRLGNAVKAHEKYRTRDGEKRNHGWCAEAGSGLVENGAAKSQIQASIIQLRRELMNLSRMFEE